MSESSLPPGHREVLYWRLTQKRGRAFAINLLAFPMLWLFSQIFISLMRLLNRPQTPVLTVEINPLQLLLALILLIPAHELMHGIAMRLYGARPRYGFMWKGLMFYATAPDYAFRRNQYLAVILAPLVVLSLLACCVILLATNASSALTAAIFGAVNGAASTGDLWIGAIVLRYPAHAYVIDERDGMRILLPTG